MMKKFIYSTLTATVVVLLLQACYKDLGNYDYHTINGVEISGIDEAYETMNGRLTIQPELKDSTGTVTEANEDRYSYAWFTFRAGMADTLSTARQLIDHPLGLSQASYTVYYRVTDKNTGVFTTADFRLTVTNEIGQGFLVLNDIDGIARLDMLSWYNNTFNSITDVVGNDLPPQTNPIKVTMSPTPIWPGNRNAVYLLSQSGTVKLDRTLTYRPETIYNVSSDFIPGSCPPGFVAENLCITDRSVVIIYSTLLAGSGDLYSSYYMMRPNTSWSIPVNIINGKRFTASPVVANSYGSDWLVFDNDTKSLYALPKSANRCSKIIAAGDGNFTEFTSLDNMEKELVYMGANLGVGTLIPIANNRHYVLLKDAANDYWILRMNSASGSFKQDVWQKIGSKGTGATDINKATCFAVGGVYHNSLYYAVDGKIYKYNIPEDISYEVLDKSPEKITYMDFNAFGTYAMGTASPGYYDLFRCMTVGSYNESGKKGTLAVYDVYEGADTWTVHNHAINGEPMEWKDAGFGKIVSVIWKPVY